MRFLIMEFFNASISIRVEKLINQLINLRYSKHSWNKMYNTSVTTANGVTLLRKRLHCSIGLYNPVAYLHHIRAIHSRYILCLTTREAGKGKRFSSLQSNWWKQERLRRKKSVMSSIRLHNTVLLPKTAPQSPLQ